MCFSIFQHFGRFHGNGGHFENSESCLHIYSVLNIPVKFHWFPFSSRREMCRINLAEERKKEYGWQISQLVGWNCIKQLSTIYLHLPVELREPHLRQDKTHHGAQIMTTSIKYNHNKIIKKHKYNCSTILWLGNIKRKKTEKCL